MRWGGKEELNSTERSSLGLCDGVNDAKKFNADVLCGGACV
jgi:hypothetical protein